MTSRGLEIYLENSVHNFSTGSMIVLKKLVCEGEDTTPEADVNFISNVTNFFNNPDNLWRKRKGKYIDDSEKAKALRTRALTEYSRELGIASDRIESLISRIMGSVARALNRKPDLLQDAFVYAHRGFVGQDENPITSDEEWRPELETAEGEPLTGELTYEDIEEALSDPRIYEEA